MNPVKQSTKQPSPKEGLASSYSETGSHTNSAVVFFHLIPELWLGGGVQSDIMACLLVDVLTSGQIGSEFCIAIFAALALIARKWQTVLDPVVILCDPF